jgi:hypothetical protein
MGIKKKKKKIMVGFTKKTKKSVTVLNPRVNYSKSRCNDWFLNFQIIEVNETSLSTNQEKSKMKRMTWKVEGDSSQEPTPIKGGPIDNSALVVELGPMEIRTFLLKFILPSF